MLRVADDLAWSRVSFCHTYVDEMQGGGGIVLTANNGLGCDAEPYV